jgi:hypothetical protein
MDMDRMREEEKREVWYVEVSGVWWGGRSAITV